MAPSLAVQTISSVIAASTPLVFAGIGETLTEKAGVTNLSLDGTILLTAMAAFAVAYLSGSLLLGIVAAMVVGALIALIVAAGSIALKQNQVAVGFVLTLLCADLSSFLGRPFVRIPGPSVPHRPIPGLVSLPVVGPILFNHNLLVYLSFAVILGAWLWMSRTQQGLLLRSVGERPEAAFARGVNVHRTRYLYALVGGALVGLAGATYSLSVKLGWSHQHTAGEGWIALAIVIFGGWSPWRVALGAYFFGALKSMGSLMQPAFPNVPTQVFQAAPFALMIIVLLISGSGFTERLLAVLPLGVRRVLAGVLRGAPPSALGKAFEPD
ncbi:MAG: ABC transporter permease [Chloroflexi bacterium]|nr:ABC transporter permease [Chloroflexota bacterium]